MESRQIAIPGRLEAVLKNVRAAREVYDYIASDGIERDLHSVRQALVNHLSHSIQMPEGWRSPYPEEDFIWLRPERKWTVLGNDSIAIGIKLPSPVAIDGDDQDVSVNLQVPFSRKLLERFTASLRRIVPPDKNWVHILDSDPDEGNLPEYPMFKWVRYEVYADSTGFDTARFFDAITGAVNELLQLEGEIDRLFEETKATGATVPHGQPKRQKSSGRPK